MNADIARTIDWLPEDTETIIVDRQPHALGAAGDMTPIDGISRFSFIYSLHNRTLGPVYSPFAKTKIALVIEGSRKFRAPKDIGPNPYEGATIVYFQDPISERLQAECRKNADKNIKVKGYDVTVFDSKLVRNNVIAHLAVVNANVVIIASHLSYLEDTLGRIGDKGKGRALPAALPEWKYLNPEATVWAIRHYNRRELLEDPTSPFDKNSAYMHDANAIGLVYQYMSKEQKCEVYHITAKESVEEIRENWQALREDEEVKLKADIATIDGRAIRIAVKPRQASEIAYFKIFVNTALGHGASY